MIRPRSHQVLDSYTSVVTVGVVRKTAQTLVGRSLTTNCTLTVGVSNQAVTCFEPDVRLEGVSCNASHHLQRNVGAIEETCVIGAGALITSHVVLGVADVS